jgi:uncharacterized protein (TIGR03437 family)
MRKLWFVFPLLLSSAILARSQVVAARQILAGGGNDVPTAIATDNRGFVYVAGNTTSTNFPVTNALESQPPQGALEVSIDGASFVNADINLLSPTANPSEPGVTAVAASSDGKLVIIATNSTTQRSTDGGVTWQPSADASAAAAVALAVDPVDPSNVYAITPGGKFYRSSNGGVNWQPITGPPNTLPSSPPNTIGPPPPVIASIAMDPRGPGRLYVWGSAAVYRSTDGGQSWQPLSIPLANGLNGQYPVSVFTLAPADPNVLYVASAIPAPVLRSADGGSTWTPGADINTSGGPTALAVDPTDPSTVWLAAADGTLQKSTDGGATFQSTALGNDPGAYTIAIDPANHLRVYAVAYNNNAVWETSDGGATWSEALVGYALYLYAAPSRVYAFTNNVPTTVFLAKLDASLSQVIYCTYLWTGFVTGIAVDGEGNVALTGTDPAGAVAMKVRADDSSVLYSMVLNGTGVQPSAIAMDAAGNAVITGSAYSLATTKGAYESALPGKCPSFPGVVGLAPAFVAKLNSSGAMVYATYLSGACGGPAYGLALDSSGDAYVAGETFAPDFPITQNAMISQFPSSVFSGFLSKLSPAGELLYSTFLGGGNYTTANAVTLDGGGNIYVAGSTQASATAGAAHALSGPGCFSEYPPSWQSDNAFVLKMTASAAPAAFLATVGGSCQGEAESIALDAAGNIWLSGFNGSVNFPTRVPLEGLGQLNGVVPLASTGFVAELNPAGTTLLSGTTTDYGPGTLAADSTAVYYAGPLGPSVLVAEIDPTQVAPISLDEIVQYAPLLPAASRLPVSVAPGEIVRILGRGIGPQNEAMAKLTAAGTLATSIGGVQVTFNGVPAPLVTAQAGQIECIAPFELEGLQSAAVEVQYNGQTSNTYTVGVVPQNPDVLAVANPDWSANSPSNPAKPGSQVTIFLTGLGQTVPPSVDGAINQAPPAQLQALPVINFESAIADVTFIGAAVFEVAGVAQLNMILPNPAASQFLVSIGLNATATVYVAQ